MDVALALETKLRFPISSAWCGRTTASMHIALVFVFPANFQSESVLLTRLMVVVNSINILVLHSRKARALEGEKEHGLQLSPNDFVVKTSLRLTRFEWLIFFH